MENWPATLPQRLLQNGYQDEEPDYVLKTQMDRAVPKLRRRFTAAIRPFSGQMVITPTQKGNLKTFYLNNCASAFLFNDPDTGSPTSCIFLEKPVYTAAGGIYQKVTLKLGIKP